MSLTHINSVGNRPIISRNMNITPSCYDNKCRRDKRSKVGHRSKPSAATTVNSKCRSSLHSETRHFTFLFQTEPHPFRCFCQRTSSERGPPELNCLRFPRKRLWNIPVPMTSGQEGLTNPETETSVLQAPRLLRRLPLSFSQETREPSCSGHSTVPTSHLEPAGQLFNRTLLLKQPLTLTT